MTLLIAFLFLNALAIWGFHIATDVKMMDDDYPEHGYINSSKMIFWKVKVWCLTNLGYFWSKPVCLCPPCMSSLHSTYFYAFFLYLNGFALQWIAFYPMYILILTGINYFISITVSRIKDTN